MDYETNPSSKEASSNSNNPVWHNGGSLEELAMKVGFKASNASRRLRELCEDELIDREIRKGKKVSSVWYRIKLAETLF